MRIFALETDRTKVQERFCHAGECVVLHTYYHVFYFLFHALKEILVTAVIVAITALCLWFGWPVGWTLGIAGALWLGLAFFPLMKCYIDWHYDCILVTSDKVILVDQTSIFKQEIKPIHIENIGSVSTETQFWGLFPFGKIIISLKEGDGGERIVRRYVPDAKIVAGKISDVVTHYQRGEFSPNDPPHRQRTDFPGESTAQPQPAAAPQPVAAPQPAARPPAPAVPAAATPPAPTANPGQQRQQLAQQVTQQAAQSAAQPQPAPAAPPVQNAPAA